MLDKPVAAPSLAESFVSGQIIEDSSHVHIAVVGLGYVGLPLAVEFGKRLPVVGFDINPARIAALEAGHDATLEISDEELRNTADLRFTHDLADLADCNVFIVTVPTPIDEHKRPDLTPLIKASQTIGKVLKKDDIVIYESTVYPGATEEECVPVLEAFSGLTFNLDFYVGYSPERINPGDKQHRLSAIKKVTSGSTPAVADKDRSTLRADYRRGNAQGSQHQSGGSRQGHREHSARPQHRVGQRTRHHLRAKWASTPKQCCRRLAPSGTSCRSGRA